MTSVWSPIAQITDSRTRKDVIAKLLIIIVVQAKYFPDSDWLKAHA